MTLCFSRHQYAEIVWRQDVQTWLACHRRAFEWFGGVPSKLTITPRGHPLAALCKERDLRSRYTRDTCTTSTNFFTSTVLQNCIAPFASWRGCVNRTSHPSGSSGNVTAFSALAAKPPQKHLGTVLRPIDCADLWLP
jgi:hypothetical protein